VLSNRPFLGGDQPAPLMQAPRCASAVNWCHCADQRRSPQETGHRNGYPWHGRVQPLRQVGEFLLPSGLIAIGHDGHIAGRTISPGFAGLTHTGHISVLLDAGLQRVVARLGPVVYLRDVIRVVIHPGPTASDYSAAALLAAARACVARIGA
jgi:hypothetical protein